MNLTPENFLRLIAKGKTEKELNQKETLYADYETRPRKNPPNSLYLIRYCGHTPESAYEYLNTDYSDGFTICDTCGSYFHLGDGFTKHLSHGCVFCEDEAKHRSYHVNASKPSEGGFPARTMCVMFDDGMSYTKDKLQIEKFLHILPVKVTKE